MAAFRSAAAEMSTASMKDLSAFCDKTLSTQGYSILWKHCDRKGDRAELREKHSIDIKKKKSVYLNIFQRETGIPKALLNIWYAAWLEKQFL